METKPLLYGLIGFFIGGLLVAVAATTFNKTDDQSAENNSMSMSSMSMEDMTTDLQGKTGDDYDKAFIASMIAHHQGAIDMAKLSANQAKHDEIKELSQAIISAQEKEIAEMKQWQEEWGYPSTTKMDGMSHSMH